MKIKIAAILLPLLVSLCGLTLAEEKDLYDVSLDIFEKVGPYAHGGISVDWDDNSPIAYINILYDRPDVQEKIEAAISKDDPSTVIRHVRFSEGELEDLKDQFLKKTTI